MARRRSIRSFVARHTGKLFNLLERAFLAEQARLMARRMDEFFSNGDFRPGVSFPGESQSDAIMADLCAQAWHWGWRHGQQETAAAALRVSQQFSVPGPGGLLPVDAIEWAKRRVVLLGRWQRALDTAINAIIVQALETGATNKQLMATLKQVLPTFTKPRLEVIARTETASAYNNGRIQYFRKSQFVEAVQFTAILDARTTKICRKRDGLVMKLTDDRLATNTPPLHFNCRSVLIPVDRFDWEDLQNGDKDAQQAVFGWVGDDGPKNLKEALAGWDSAPAPLAGFGSLQQLQQKGKK